MYKGARVKCTLARATSLPARPVEAGAAAGQGPVLVEGECDPGLANMVVAGNRP
jgi:hypothetical protein